MKPMVQGKFPSQTTAKPIGPGADAPPVYNPFASVQRKTAPPVYRFNKTRVQCIATPQTYRPIQSIQMNSMISPPIYWTEGSKNIQPLNLSPVCSSIHEIRAIVPIIHSSEFSGNLRPTGISSRTNSLPFIPRISRSTAVIQQMENDAKCPVCGMKTYGYDCPKCYKKQLKEEEEPIVKAIKVKKPPEKNGFIGIQGKHHIHICPPATHYKNGNNKGGKISLMNKNLDYVIAELQSVIDLLTKSHAKDVEIDFEQRKNPEKFKCKITGALICLEWCQQMIDYL